MGAGDGAGEAGRAGRTAEAELDVTLDAAVRATMPVNKESVMPNCC